MGFDTPMTTVHRIQRWLPACALLALLVVAAGGCGGGEQGASSDRYAKWGGLSKDEYLKRKADKEAAEKKKEEEARKQAEAAKQQKADQQADEARRLAAEAAAKNKKINKRQSSNSQSDESETDQSQSDTNESSPAQAPPAGDATEKPDEAPAALPPAVADWKDEDFFLARLTDSPTLIAAVNHVASHRVGDENAARLLGGLLQALPSGKVPEKSARSGRRRRTSTRNGADHAPLLEAIVAALVANETDAAREFLRQLLLGELKTDDNQTAAFAALEGLVDHPCPENEAIVFEFLVSPRDVRLPGREGVDADALCDQALAWLNSKASISLRLKLSRHLVQGRVPQALEPSLDRLLASANPANLEAQIVLYQNSLIRQADTQQVFEERFLGYSSDAWGGLLASQGGAVSSDGRSELSSRVARWLWGPQFQALLAIRLSRIPSMQDAASTTLLASTVPADSARKDLYQLLRRRWHEGPKAIEPAVAGRDVICDPALLVLLKLVCRDSRVPEAYTSGAISTNSRDKVAETLEARRELEEEWLEAARTLLDTKCRQFEAAALRKAVYGQDCPLPKSLPVELPPDLPVIAAYSLDWPGDVRYAMASAPPDPLAVRYVQLRGEAEQVGLVGFFRHQLKPCQEHEFDHEVWLDTIRDGTAPDRQQSVDVRVRVADPQRPALPGEAESLIVDILSVEVGALRATLPQPAKPDEKLTAN